MLKIENMSITILETGMTIEEQTKIAEEILKEKVIPQNIIFEKKSKTNKLSKRLQTALKQNG